jgi:hypothetical protein
MNMNFTDTCSRAFLEWSFNLLPSFVKNDFCRTLQIEPSYILDLSHNLQKYIIDVMHSDTIRFA